MLRLRTRLPVFFLIPLLFFATPLRADDENPCNLVDCAECHECIVNSANQARCVRQPTCCPGGQQGNPCFVDPCDQRFNDKCPDAKHCISDYCGGCNAHYYDCNWNEICQRGNEAPQLDYCRDNDCTSEENCVPEPKNCFTTPCPQYKCVPRNRVKRSPCHSVRCAQCTECRVNDENRARCVYKEGCCLPGSPKINCLVSPCMPRVVNATCPMATRCITDCSGCRAHFYDPGYNELCVREHDDHLQSYCIDNLCPPGTRCVPFPQQATDRPYRCESTAPGTVSDKLSPCANVRCMFRCEVKNGRAVCVDPARDDSKLTKCSQLPETGPCRALFPRYHYSRVHSECRKFDYGGCQGNENNFETKEQCETACSGVDPCPIYSIRVELGCRLNGEKLNNETLCPVPVIVCDQKQKIKRCSQLVSQGVACRNNGNSRGKAGNRWHYSRVNGQCSQFRYNGCGGNKNRFTTKQKCEQYCDGLPPCPVYKLKAPKAGCEWRFDLLDEESLCPDPYEFCPPPPETYARCQLPKATGNCSTPKVAFFFNANTSQCERFTYSGCKGNNNGFPTSPFCQRVCIEHRRCQLRPIPRPPLGCHYEVFGDEEGCPDFKLICDNDRLIDS